MTKSNEVLIPLKHILIIVQFLLLIFVNVTCSEYIFVGLPKRTTFDSQIFQLAYIEIQALTATGIALILLEFIFAVIGVTVVYPKAVFY